MAGKNKIERWIYVFFDDSGDNARNLSSDIVPGSMSGLGGKIFDEIEMTGISEAHKNFLAGHWMNEFTAQFYLNDTATTGAYTVLYGVEGAVGTLTIQFGDGAAPSGGEPEWEGEYLLAAAPIQIAAGKAVIAARFVPGGSTAPAWGTV